MRLFGHPVHPMLVHFPVSFWTLACVCDGLALFAVEQAWRYGWIALALGLVLAVPAMIAGFVDLAGLPPSAEGDGQRHMVLMSLAWTAFLVALILRFEGTAPNPVPQVLSMAFTLLGTAIMAVGAWYGGRLVYTHGAGRSSGGAGIL